MSETKETILLTKPDFDLNVKANEKPLKCRVQIRRQATDYRADEAVESCFSNVVWDNTCGGAQKRQAVISVYGYMDYEAAKETSIAISGEHSLGYNYAKVCISKKDNMGKKNAKYEPAYCRFIVQADHNPKSKFRDYKLTKTISSFLKKHSVGMTRKDLMNELVSDENDAKALREALTILSKAGYLSIEGTPRGQNSILSLVEGFPY